MHNHHIFFRYLSSILVAHHSTIHHYVFFFLHLASCPHPCIAIPSSPGSITIRLFVVRRSRCHVVVVVACLGQIRDWSRAEKNSCVLFWCELGLTITFSLWRIRSNQHCAVWQLDEPDAAGWSGPVLVDTVLDWRYMSDLVLRLKKLTMSVLVLRLNINCYWFVVLG